MICGHVISVESMTVFLRSIIDSHKYVIKCPSLNNKGEFCDTEWSYSVCREVGQLTQAEMEEFEEKLSYYMGKDAMGANECPTCRTFMMKDEEHKSNRVECVICKKSGKSTIFCWICL